jgi:uncharacterized protein (TIGR03086 family)
MAYTLGSLLLVTPGAMSNRTPCAEWDLRALLLHMNDSLLTLDHAIARGRVDLGQVTAGGPTADPAADPVASLRDRACRMIGSWTGSSRPGEIAVAGRALPSGVVAATGALEVTVHGWDVARACGRDRPIPRALAEELLGPAHVLIGDADRPHSFGAPVGVPPGTAAGNRLLAVTGRDPAIRPGDRLR